MAGEPSAAASRNGDRLADPADSGFAPDADLFYDPDHRHRIRAMMAHVIEVEGPMFDVLVTRIARARGVRRAAGRIREVIGSVIGPD